MATGQQFYHQQQQIPSNLVNLAAQQNPLYNYKIKEGAEPAGPDQGAPQPNIAEKMHTIESQKTRQYPANESAETSSFKSANKKLKNKTQIKKTNSLGKFNMTFYQFVANQNNPVPSSNNNNPGNNQFEYDKDIRAKVNREPK